MKNNRDNKTSEKLKTVKIEISNSSLRDEKMFKGLVAVASVSITLLLVWALAADAIDYNEVRYGLHDEATSYSFYSFMRKLGQTVAAVLINSVLLKIGYTDNVLNADNITPDVLNHMYNSSALIPAVLFLLVFLLLRFVYPLSKEKIAELQVEKEKILQAKQ